ncbi:hypothetical protein A2641_03440 [Candidatus Nomurabacteria bacterium RIFCSPHIGHO2_01_FULL_37_25]|uniref:Uncharacterized protein n=1 Tax=Candidatus Nomurabacteria bacterium RIFCSPLOWO2_01_FULL_36_16 TaxID=1801767 RepID=A0A1F6WZQ5_9BACT|nr:MAG: hypothetical protein A2641_03440 [Candidatus Nomurabacteria bacterium RIFCSPHIGHO2_01_FULL_37_25]OGI75543.1 MAG: hypothetical protein A3D36_03085 [Candidatus Nomurabacteria bacterium RIFCSPHIGHO2_02_FULL_36_29]OGI87381.1 MAG: hypothetical protein A3A91_02705 [Candidatus Nomurabacteria bacterium RIFCSPLOWO2_01_FULL_36_16]OGI96860.1 MAG: hypothetical protein A3I84_03020 [Candidatus Nomurabacteria bacterium RIFCSPLOWO2_02_FULL_36_8]
MTKTTKFFISLAVFLMLVAPVISFAAFDPLKGLVPCNNTPDDSGTIAEPCNFTAFMKLINNIIDFILFYMAIPIAAIMFFYAGFKLVTSGGSTEARGKAKNIFTNAVIGLVLAAAAWLIVKTLLSILGYKDIDRFF